MIENVMNQMGGIGIFGIISICIFFGFFAGMLLWAARLKKTYLNSMSDLPLEAEPAIAEQGRPGPAAARQVSGRLPAKTPYQN